MTATMVIWWTSCLLVAVPLAVAVERMIWIVWPAQRSMIESVLPSTMWGARTSLGALVVLQLLLLAASGMAFVSPRNTVRDRIRMLWRSRTGRWCALSVALAFALLVLTRYPIGDTRPFTTTVLSVALAGTLILGGRGLTRIYRSNRAVPYFEGMTEHEKTLADQPRSEAVRPSFPLPESALTADDAYRYARRAKTITETHVWVGGALIVIFSAFIGTSIVAMWESMEFTAWIPVYLVLGALAIGFWIQRRARAYDDLRKRFTARAEALEIEAEAAAAAAQKQAARGAGLGPVAALLASITRGLFRPRVTARPLTTARVPSPDQHPAPAFRAPTAAAVPRNGSGSP